MSSVSEYRKKLIEQYSGKSSKKKDDEEEKKSNTSSTDTSSTETIKPYKKSAYREELLKKYTTDKIKSTDVDKWFDNVSSVFKDMEADNTQDYSGRIKNLLNSSKDVYNYLQNNKDYLEDFDLWDKAFSQNRSALRNVDKWYYDKNYELNKIDNMSIDEIRAKIEASETVGDVLQNATKALEARKKGTPDKELEKDLAYVVEKYGLNPDTVKESDILRIYTNVGEDLKPIDLNVETPESSIAYYDADGTAVSWKNLLRIKSTEERMSKMEKSPEVKAAYDELVEYRDDIKRLENAQFAISAKAEGIAPDSEYEKDLGYAIEKYGLDPTLDMKQPIYEIYMQLVDGSYSGMEEQKAVLEAAGYDWDEFEAYKKYFEDKEREKELQKSYRMVAEDYPALSTIFSIASAPGQIWDYAKDLVYMAQNSDAADDSFRGMTNVYDNGATNFTSTITSTVANKIDKDVTEATGQEWVGWLASSAYSGGTSALQSAATTAVCVGLFGAAGSTISLGLQGSQAAASSFSSAIKNGSTNGEALATSIASGVAEGLFEKVSLDHFLKISKGYDVTTLSGLFKSIAKDSKNLVLQGLVESSEEMFTEIANNLADDIINGDHSEYSAAVAQYKSNGYSEEEAKKMAAIDYATNVLSAMVGGFIGGVSSGSVAVGTNAIKGTGAYINYQNETVKPHGSALIKQGSTDSLMDFARETAKTDSKLNKYIDKVTKKASAKNVGTLSLKVEQSLSKQNLSDITKHFENKGTETKEAKKLAGYVNKLLEGEALTQEDKAELRNLKVGEAQIKSALADIVSDPESPINIREADLMLARMGYKGKVTDELTKSSTTKVTETKDAIESGDIAVSENGKAKILSSDETVTIDKNNAIAKIEDVDGNTVVYYNTDKGEVAASDISYASESDALLFEAFTDLSPSVASSLIRNYANIKNNPVSVDAYVEGMREGILFYGKYGFREVGKDILEGSAFAKLPKQYQSTALNIGREVSKNETKTKQDKINSGTTKANQNGKGRVYFENGAKAGNSSQKRAVSLAKHIASAIGINIAFYDSTISGTVNSDANGWFDRETDTIHLDLQKAVSDKHTIAFTLSHEIVHFIEKWSPEKYKVLADFLMTQYAKHGVKTEVLLQNKMAALNTTDVDLAYREMVADAMESMLLDSNATVKLMELRQKDAGLFNKLKAHILDLINKIRNEYKNRGYEPTSEEGKAVRAMEDSLSEFHKLFEEALVGATESYQNAEVLNTESVSVSADGTVQLQMKQYEQTGRSTLLNYLKQQYGESDANDLISTIDNIYNAMAELKQDTALSVFGNWQDTEVELDANGHPIFTTSINNGDYELNQDFSRVCKKRRQLDFVLNMLAEDPAFEASNLTKEDFVKINEAIKNHGFEIACALCFVDSKRFRQAEWADSFANTWNDILNSMMSSDKALSRFNFATANPNMSDDGIDIDTSKPISFRKWSDGKAKETRHYKNLDDLLENEGNANVRTIAKLIRDNPKLRHEFRGADIIASRGFDSLQRLAPDVRGILDGWGGTSVPKPSSNDAIYDNSVLNIAGYNAKKAFAVGGVRMNSFSDFMAHMFFDYAQAFADLSAKKLPMHSYTKELDFARLFGLSGGKINMSAIAAIRSNATDISKIKDKAQKEAATEREKSIAGLDISRLAEKLGKNESDITYDDVIQNLDDVDYVWADESIDVKSATLLQSGILYDKLSDGQAAYCYELIREGKFEEAFKVAGEENVNKAYAKHLGIITVGVSKAHILKLMRDPTIRMVIPYHKSGLNATIAKALKIAFYNDYTDVQNTMFSKNGEAVGLSKDGAKVNGSKIREFSFYDYFGKTIDGVFYDGKATADKYLDWCRNGEYDESVGDYVYYLKNGDYILASELHAQGIEIIPKFNEFSAEENYYKLIEDFDCYDTITGEHSQQEAVDIFHDGLPSDYKKVLAEALKTEQQVSDDFKDHLDNKGLRDEIMKIVKARGYTPSVDRVQKQAKMKDGDGNSYWQIESEKDIFKNLTTVKELQKAAYNYILRGNKGNKIRGLIDGQDLEFIRVSAGEYVYGTDAKKLTEKEYKQKMRMSTSVIDLIDNASISYDAPDHKNHKLFPNGFKNYQGRVGIDETIFRYIVRVGKAKNGMIFYDIFLEVDGKVPHANRTSLIKSSTSTNRISQKENSVKDQFQKKTTSNRELLANALEDTVQNHIERNKLVQYKEKIDLLNEEEQKLRELRGQIKDLSFAKGKRDTEKIMELQAQANNSATLVNKYDRELLKLESAKVLKDVLEREKAMVRKRMEEKGRELKAKAVQKKTESIYRKREKDKLQKLILDTARWIKAPRKEEVKCPDFFKEPFANFLESIDMSSKKFLNKGHATKNDFRIASTMDSLATAIDKIRKSQNPSEKADSDSDSYFDSGYLDLPDNFVENIRLTAEGIKFMIENSGGDGLDVVEEMTSEEMKEISKIIKVLKHSITEMQTLYTNYRFANIKELGRNSVDYLESLGKAANQNGLKDFAKWDNGLPFYVFKRFGGAGESIFESLMDSQDKLAFLADEIFKFKENNWSDEEVKSWSKDVHTIELTGGKKITLTTADAMGFYCLYQRELSLGGFVNHLFSGGIKVVDESVDKSKGDKVTETHLTQADVSKIIESLDKRQIEVADKIQNFMSTECAKWGNEIFYKRFLTNMFTEQKYYPIESNPQGMDYKDPSAQQSDMFRLLNISATKPLTKGANNQIIIKNIFNVFAAHTSDMAKLNAYGMALLDYMKWINYKEKTTDTKTGQITVKGVRKSLDTAFEEAAFKYVTNLIKDVNGRGNIGDENAFAMEMIRRSKVAAVGSNLRVALLQPTALPRAMVVLRRRSILYGLKGLAHPKKSIEMAKKYCGIALWKSFGFYDTNITRGVEQQIKGGEKPTGKLVEASMKFAELGDSLTWGCLWNACEFEVAKSKKYEIGTEAFYQAVGKKLREVVYSSQVVDSVLTRSQLMRKKGGVTQMATSYMGEPTLSYNILLDAESQFSNAKRSTGSAKAAWAKTGSLVKKAVTAYMTTQILAAVVEALADAFRDDEEKPFGEKFFGAAWQNLLSDLMPLNKIPILNDFVNLVMSKMGVGYFSTNDMSTDYLTTLSKAWDAWADIIKNGDEADKTLYYAIFNSTKFASQFTGLPISNAMREVVTIWNNTAGNADYRLKLSTYESSSSVNAENLYRAIVSGDTERAKKLEKLWDSEGKKLSALRTALRENDPRIKLAAKARYDGNIAEYEKIAKEIISEGNFNQDTVVAAINTEVSKLKPKSESEGSDVPLFTSEDYYKAIVYGNSSTVSTVKNYLIEESVAAGNTVSEAEKSIASGFVGQAKKAYMNGTLTKSKAISLVDQYGGDNVDGSKKVKEWDFEIDVGYTWGSRDNAYRLEVVSKDRLISYIMDIEDKTRNEAMNEIKAIEFKTDYPEYSSISSTTIAKYYEKVEDTNYTLADKGIDIEEFADYCVKVSGKTKKEDKLKVINKLPLSSSQKDALYYFNGWAKSTLYEAPWH